MQVYHKYNKRTRKRRKEMFQDTKMKILNFFDSMDYSVSNWGKLWDSYGLEILVLLNLFIFFVYWIITMVSSGKKKGRMSDPQHLSYLSRKNGMINKKRKRIIEDQRKRIIEDKRIDQRIDDRRIDQRIDERIDERIDDRILKKKGNKMSKGESECKRCLENIFKMPFEKVRPNFLRNPVTNKNLELDLYNSHLKLACEYNGEQHYIQSEMFTKESVNSIKYRDELKKIMCEQNGVYLIVVPYTIKIKDIENFIVRHVVRWRAIKTRNL